MTTDRPEGISALRRLAYASPAFALAVVGLPLFVFLPKFYTDVVGVDIALLGTIILGVRLFDAVTDPLIGLLSDRTRTRFGRRRPWIVGASLPLALFIWLIFDPPEADPTTTVTRLTLCVFALFICWTAVNVPYESLGPEITFDYDERTSLLGLRDGMMLIGIVAAVLSPDALRWALDLPSDASGERARFRAFALLYAPMVVLLCGVCVLSIRERRARPVQRFALGPGLRLMAGNRPFRILLVAYTVGALGGSLPGTLIPYYVEYVLGSDQVGVFLLLYFVVGVLFLPAWVWLAHRIGKKAAWIAAMLVNTGAFIGVFFLGAGAVTAYAVLVALSGVGFGAAQALPSAMQADVIDYDELRSGERREGQYLGGWAVARKLSAALGVGIALPVLGAVGYRPNVPQTPEVLTALRALYALVPSLCNLIAIAIALRYPIDRARHRDILAGIEARGRGEVIRDPLMTSDPREVR